MQWMKPYRELLRYCLDNPTVSGALPHLKVRDQSKDTTGDTLRSMIVYR
jgi:hypothetical protein